MKKLIIFSAFLIVFASCNLFDFKPVQKGMEEPVIASVYKSKLYLSDLKGVVPQGVSDKDSVVIVKSFINSWAKKKLLLKKAEENISKVNNNEINKLVKNYRESLFINGYKERLVKQQLDTVVSEAEILNYYSTNKENFRLNEELLQLEYIYFGKDFLDKEEAIKMFKSSKEEDRDSLETLTINFKDYQLRDSTWMTYDEVLLKIPPFSLDSKEKLLKISKFIQKEDSLGVYLVAVKKVLYRNDIAPLGFIDNKIKQLILYRRKSELIREIEKTLINDAIKNNNFKEY